MKKTLITLAALAASVANAAVTTYTTTTTGAADAWAYYGWSVALTDVYMSTTSNPTSASALTATDVLTLDSISLYSGKSNATGSLNSGSKLAIFSYAGDYKVGSFVGLSSNTVSVSGQMNYTYTFSNVNLTAGKQYQFLFVSSTATSDLFSTATNADNLAAYKAVSGDVNAQAKDPASNLATGDGSYTTNGINKWAGQYLVDATYTTHVGTPDTSNIPEPATATLSLLAFAGLAARRRRK